MIRLVVPAAGIAAFLLLSFATVRLLRPRRPRSYFSAYAILLLVGSGAVYVSTWGVTSIEDGLGLLACLLLQMLLCFTMWNSFYSLLWGFSGGLVHDLFNDPSVRQVERLISLYDGRSNPGRKGLDRILARRLPNLVAGGYIDFDDRVLRLRPKGRLIAVGTWCSVKCFSLGMGGGIK